MQETRSFYSGTKVTYQLCIQTVKFPHLKKESILKPLARKLIKTQAIQHNNLAESKLFHIHI